MLKTVDVLNEFFSQEKANIKSELGFNGKNHLGEVAIDKSMISSFQKESSRFISTDSNASMHEDHKSVRYGSSPRIRFKSTDSARSMIDEKVQSLMSKGMEKNKALSIATDSLDLDLDLIYDKVKDEYVKVVKTKGETINVDSIVEGAMQPWNVGILNRIVRQPYADTKANMLWSVESFSNPFCEKVALAKASFEGFGRLTSAKGNFKQNTSAPTSGEAGAIWADVYNVMIDYQSDFWEETKGKQVGNWITPQMIALREKYTKYMLGYATTVFRLFGDEESGMKGLLQASEVTPYAGVPLLSIVNGTSATKGAEVLNAIKKLVFDFLARGNFMAKEVKILCSMDVYQALCQPTYSDQFNPSAPIEELHFTFSSADVLNGSRVFDIKICPDKLCNANTPFNPEPEDLMFITTPSIEDGMGEQSSLIIAGEPLSDFIVPALWDRNGTLYTYYKRITDIIAPLGDGTTCMALRGVGTQG